MSNERKHSARPRRPMPQAVHFKPDPRWQQHFTFKSRLQEAGKAAQAVLFVVLMGVVVWFLGLGLFTLLLPQVLK